MYHPWVRIPALGAAFVTASIAWTLALPLTPYLATRAHASAFSAVLVFAVYSIGHLVCHQLPERSFHLWTAQLPVCARCTGIYVGAAAAGLVALVVSARLKPCPTSYVGRGFSRAGGFSGAGGAMTTGAARVLLGTAATPTAATLVYEWTTGAVPSNIVRAAAGFWLGAAVAWLVVQATRTGLAAENQVN